MVRVSARVCVCVGGWVRLYMCVGWGECVCVSVCARVRVGGWV